MCLVLCPAFLGHSPSSTLPNLRRRRLVFHGVGAYLESLVRRVTAPSLKEPEIFFFEEHTFFASLTRLLQFMNTVEDLSIPLPSFIPTAVITIRISYIHHPLDL